MHTTREKFNFTHFFFCPFGHKRGFIVTLKSSQVKVVRKLINHIQPYAQLHTHIQTCTHRNINMYNICYMRREYLEFWWQISVHIINLILEPSAQHFIRFILVIHNKKFHVKKSGGRSSYKLGTYREYTRE